MPDYPRHRLGLLHDLATRLLDSRKAGTPNESFARELLVRFEDVCTLAGLDRVLAELPADFEDDPTVHAALVAQLEAADLDAGGPRNARPGKVADCMVAALGLTIVDDPDTTIALDAALRTEITGLVTKIIEPALAPPVLREAIIAHARERSDPQHAAAFEKIVDQLDERGLRMKKQPKVPLDASQAIQRLLTEARHAVLGRAVTTSLDRAKPLLGAAAARVDEPVTLRQTPRDVLVARVVDDRASKVPESVVNAIVEGLTELVRITWREPEVAARPYAASQSFAVGELIDHPKFGRGTVVAVAQTRIDVEFEDGKHTLVHKR